MTPLSHNPALVPPGVAGFAIPRLVCYLGRWWYRGGWYPRPIVRLVRRTATRWGGVDPHERAEVKGRVARRLVACSSGRLRGRFPTLRGPTSSRTGTAA